MPRPHLASHAARRPGALARRAAALAGALAAAVLAVPAAASAQLLEPEGSFGSGTQPGERFVQAAGVATDDAGRVYVADTGAGHVEVFDRAADGNAYLRTIGAGVLQCPVGIRIDNRGRIYVADACRDVVVMLDSFVDGAVLRREFGGPGTQLGRMAAPRFVTVDESARVYVVERANARVQSWRPSGGQQVPIGAFGVADPPAMLSPEGIERDAAGRIYVSDDRGEGQVRVYDPRGALLATVAGPGSAPGLVSEPRGLTRDPLGRLLVADGGNGRLQVLGPIEAGARPLGATAPGVVGRPVDSALAPGALVYVVDAASGGIVRLRYDDGDRDGALDGRDTCPGLADPAQVDTDRDRRGDACDDDDDGDGVADAGDRCPRTRRGADANGDGCGDPRSSISTPRDRKTFRRRRPPSRIAGSASADELGVVRVEIALGKAVGRGCRWYDGRGFSARVGSCAEPLTWLQARGERRWEARVRLRARGTYRVLSRAVQAGGLAESVFNRRNLRVFRVR